MRKPNQLFELSDDNGYYFNSEYAIPEEVLSFILSYLPPEDLVFNCRRKFHELPWYASFWFVKKKPLNRNLIKNWCGKDNLKDWKITVNNGDKWKVESPPVGCDPLPTEAISETIQPSCFVTSYYKSGKEQVIDLKAEGALPEFIEILQPTITVSEWCSGRFDCRGVYFLKVTLLNTNEETLDSFECTKNVGAADGTSWLKVTHKFENYHPEVRYIKFSHAGQDRQFWAGHYGSKMTGASVVLSLTSATS